MFEECEMKNLKATSIAAALTVLAGCGSGSGSGSTSSTPTTPAQEAARSAPIDTSIKLPDGFVATIFADGLNRPRHIAVRDNGDVYVALRGGGIMALHDKDGDGAADDMQR